MTQVGSMPQGAGGFPLRRLLLVLPFLAGIIVGGAVIWSYATRQGGETGRSAESGGQAIRVASADSGGAGRGEETPRGESDPVNGATAASLSIDSSRRNAIVRAAQAVGPSVVSISVVQTRYVRQRVDPFGSFFDRYLPPTIYRERVPVLGSGFIIDRAGVVLTNEHVVREAEQIKVTSTDGRTFDARIVGSDPAYDLAVLKINGENLPPAEIGDSDDILVGEWAIAIGNPFGFLLNDYQPSVSVGVVSAKGRDIKQQNEGATTGIYRNMIQTDAAINPGNSGGPLVNGQGKVIGINTFIFTESGGSLGIGFAIPINVAARVVKEILQYGEVRHVWTGIEVREISPYVAAYYNITNPRGLLVVESEEGSPADRAGIQVGDIIRRINGEEVVTFAAASRQLSVAAIGDVITLTIERAGRTQDIRIRGEAEPRAVRTRG